MPTLPEGRLQFSRAVSTRFRSAEYILKMLQRQKKSLVGLKKGLNHWINHSVCALLENN